MLLHRRPRRRRPTRLVVDLSSVFYFALEDYSGFDWRERIEGIREVVAGKATFLRLTLWEDAAPWSRHLVAHCRRPDLSDAASYDVVVVSQQQRLVLVGSSSRHCLLILCFVSVDLLDVVAAEP
eukprot:scaffold46321_cov107-Amphora_coffeaeformis.AAC.1